MSAVLLGAYFFGIYAFYSSEMWNVTASTAEHDLVFEYTETL